MSDTPVPSPAAVVYGTGDLFAPPVAHFGWPTHIPCTDYKVLSGELAVQILCATFADWMGQGLITLAVVEATKLFVIHTKNVVLHATPDTVQRLPQIGVGGWLAHSIRSHNGDNMHNIIRAAYGHDYEVPSQVVTTIAAQELMALDYYADSAREIGGLGGALRKAVHASTTEHVAVPICERFAALRTYAPFVQQMLQTTGAHDPLLWEMLQKQISHAMASRTETHDNSANIG